MKDTSGLDLASFHGIVRGRVQGVNFRSFVSHHANVLGLAGYVRNLPDGKAVEVLAEGERVKLQELVKHLHEGPAWARVDDITINWNEYSGKYSTFDLRFQ